MKRILTLFIVAAMVLSTLASCARQAKPLTAQELLNLGEKYLLEGDYEQAVVHFEALIELDPTNPRGYTGLAEAYIGLGKPNKAIKVLERGLKELPGNEEIAQMLQKLQESTGDDPTNLAVSAPFGDAIEYIYTGTPSIEDFTIAPNLSNVENYEQFSSDNRNWNTSFGYWHSGDTLTQDAMRQIEKNGFTVSDKYSSSEYFQLYESNRYNYVPNFITTDSAVHTFHLMFDFVLKDLEQSKLHPILIQLSNAMTAVSYEQYKQLIGTSFETAALRNTAFFSVGSKLLSPDFTIPTEAVELVSQELSLIAAQNGITESPVINLGAPTNSIDAYQADYTQYITRSHYNQTPELKAYFQAMMWYGQMTFRSAMEDEVKSALLQSSALTDPNIATLWANIFEPTNFFVGECDDITYSQYTSALSGVYKDLSSVSELSDESKFSQTMEIIKKMPPPKINSVPIWETQDKEIAITGYRFMGQRFTVDAYVFQNLIDREVSDRMLPNSLDVPAALGSEAALELLASEVSLYPEYSSQMTKLQTEISKISPDTWTSNLYWSWLYMLLPYVDAPAGKGYPLFMQNDAWTKKELNSFQGSWTELKHDTLLYAKAAMAELGGADEEIPPAPDDRGYVEPNPVLFGRLTSLVHQTQTGLQKRGILSEEAAEALGVLYDLSVRLTAIAEAELSNVPLSEDDYEFIRIYGGELEHIWDTAKHYELSQVINEYTGEPVGDAGASGVAEYFLWQHPCGVVADVATDPDSGVALEEATGYAKTIFVVFPRDGKLVLGSGTVFSQYEFTVPISDRVTDETWHERMRQGDLLGLAKWKWSFMSDVGESRYSY